MKFCLVSNSVIPTTRMMLPMTIRTDQFSLLLLGRLDDIPWTLLVMRSLCQPIGVMHHKIRAYLAAMLTTVAMLPLKPELLSIAVTS